MLVLRQILVSRDLCCAANGSDNGYDNFTAADAAADAANDAGYNYIHCI